MSDPQIYVHHNSTVEWVPLKHIKTDPRVNTRPVDLNWVNRKLDEGFDLDKLGTPAVSQRSATKYVWLDGQHRGALATAAGFGEERLEVRVFTNLTRDQEAAIFIGLNDNRRVGAIYKFLARVTAKEEAAVEISNLVAKYGWKVAMSGEDGCISAVASLDAAYNKGPWVLDRVIGIITDAWGLDNNASDGSVIRGIAQIVYRFGDQLEAGRMAAKLRIYRGGPSRFVADAQGLRDNLGGTVANAVAQKAVQQYNRNAKQEHRLEI